MNSIIVRQERPSWVRNYLYGYRNRAGFNEVKHSSGCPGQIDNAPLYERATVIDFHFHGIAVV